MDHGFSTLEEIGLMLEDDIREIGKNVAQRAKLRELIRQINDYPKAPPSNRHSSSPAAATTPTKAPPAISPPAESQDLSCIALPDIFDTLNETTPDPSPDPLNVIYTFQPQVETVERGLIVEKSILSYDTASASIPASENELVALLKKSAIGNELLKERDTILGDSKSYELTDIIVKANLNPLNLHKRVPSAVWMHWANLVETVFKLEKASSYFRTEGVPKPTGRFLNRANRIRRGKRRSSLESDSGGSSPRTNSNSPVTPRVSPRDAIYRPKGNRCCGGETAEEDEFLGDTIEVVANEWLLTATEPWDLVVSKWRLSYNIRYDWLRDKNLTHLTAADYFNKYPALKLPNGHSLVLVEYDDVEWHRREWISIHKEGMFHAFLVEEDLVWSDRTDPYNSTNRSISWPALSFSAIVDKVDMQSQLRAVEFLVDNELAFRDFTRIEPFRGVDQKLLSDIDEYPDVVAAVRKWLEYQDGQRILLTTPSVLVGFRVEVYRAEGTTQWYTAVIVGYNESTKDLTVTDDTVLEEHNEDPALVQMRLIGDGVVESIMRGEVVGITPRRSRSAAVLTQTQQPVSRVNRVSVTRNQANSTLRRLKVKVQPNVSEPLPPPTPLAPPASSTPTRSPQPAAPSPTPDSSEKGQCETVPSQEVSKPDEPKNEVEPPAKSEQVSDSKTSVESVQTENTSCSESDDLGKTQCSGSGDAVNAPPPHDDAERMEEPGGTARFPDDRSDSGVSSLRSGSGDERSGSRSSALSSSDEPPQQPVATRSPLFLPAAEKPCSDSVRVWRDPSLTAEPRVRHVHSVQHHSLLMSHPPAASAPQPPSSSAPPGVSAQAQALALAQAQAAHYPPPPPPLLSPHPLHVSLPPPGLYSQVSDMLWKQRYGPVPVPPHLLGTAEELMERERAYAQDRDRLIRREQEVREMEKHKEREKMEREREIRERDRQDRERKDREERERKEQQRIAEQAVHKHFEESLRLAQQKQKWPPNVINTLGQVQDDRKRVEEQQQRLRQERYYPQRPSSNPSRLDYPPPAHRGMSKPSSLPKAEPNINLFSYPSYCHPKSLPTPPPLTTDSKSSVIVKNDGKGPLEAKVPAHSAKMHKFDYRGIEKHYRPPPPPHGMMHPRLSYAAKPATVGSYPYPAPPGKSKVSSPAPPHMYGKPTAGITTGIPVCRTQEAIPLTKPPASPSPYQQVALHQPPPVSQVAGPPPPPAHTSKAALHPGLHTASPPCASAPRNPLFFQTQPLDLGLSERSGSPKRKAPTPVDMDLSKRPRQSPPAPPLLARVSEPSPLVAGAATTITTVVNTAAFLPEATLSPSPRPSPGLRPSPGPSPSLSPAPASSPAPPSCAPSKPVHKLKKAWLQSYSGEDGLDTEGAVGSGSCETLPMPRTTPVPPLALPNAVNSVGKSPPKLPKKSVKEPTLNGHAEPAKTESSSSEPEARKSPAKRKTKVKKKKKTGKRAAEDSNTSNNVKKKKAAGATPAASETSESERESGSDKDSDSGSSKRSGKEPKKRGRRPKGSKNEDEEPRGKRVKEEPAAPARDPLRKPPVATLKKTGEFFLQDGPCFEVAPKLGKCRECRWTPNQRSKNMPNIFCRFYAFRRLRYTKNGQLAIAGFSDPHNDPSEEDLKLWLPPTDSPNDLSIAMSKFIVQQVGDQFCELLRQEKEAENINPSEEKTIAWKRVVQGVREMCDVCETTLFNYHWACGKCGFVVCLDCYKGRKNGEVPHFGDLSRDRDDFSWLQCTNRQPHEQEKLILTQIIAGDAMSVVMRRFHEVRAMCGISQKCDCPLSKEVKPNGITKDLLKSIVKTEGLNGVRSDIKEEEKENKKKGGCAANGSAIKTEVNQLSSSWGNDEEAGDEADTGSGTDSDKEGNYSTLRELLIRPASLSGDGGSPPSPHSPVNIKQEPSPGRRKEERRKVKTEPKDTITAVEIKCEHSEDVKDLKRVSPVLDPSMRRSMTLSESRENFPGVPHSWLCDGKLLRLNDRNCENNYAIFKDQWTRGMPALVRDVAKSLNGAIWHPNTFAEEFGDEKNDLVNCMTGKIVPNQPMRKFWEGFESYNKRLKDEKGNAMLLKLKDWPPGEDFAEVLPTRFTDLMGALPLPKYTHRSGQFNLASRLPDCFVRPDLGPKMYNAYGSAFCTDKGTTNLHLDVSDAVNVMVYIGIPKDYLYEEHIKEAFRSIDEAGCDILTRRRVREKGELPGALWHIYDARDANKIRDLLNKVKKERGGRLAPNHDPIHDQDSYLDSTLRTRLMEEYGVQGYTIVQCLGDAIFIPAGAPHQVRNLHNCIKVAQDFVSPENVANCFRMTQELRKLSLQHLNREDKLQIKNIMYHAVKDSVTVLTNALRPSSPSATS